MLSRALEVLRNSMISGCFFAFIGLALSISFSARATTFLERPFPRNVQDAPVIVHGTVGETFVDWGHERDGSKRIFTYWELRVSEVLKGDAGTGTLRMREMGGEKDGTGMQVAGTATFGSGEDVVVFLEEKNTEGTYDVWGMMMGKYTLQKDADGSEYLVGSGINSLTRPRIGDGEESASASPKPKWTLEALRQLIASQGGKRAEPPLPSPRAVAPKPSPEASPVPAPSLQPSAPEAPSPYPWIALIAGALLFALVLVTRKR